MKKLTACLLASALAATGALAGCGQDDVDVASHNLSKDADNFKVDRRVVVFNGITDQYLLSVEGRCSILDEGHQLEIVCKVRDGYKKHFAGLSDNVSYFVEQLDGARVSTSHYKVTFKPTTIIPEPEIR